MVERVFFLIEISAASALMCALHHLRHRLGPAPLYLAVGLFEAFLFFTGKAAEPITAGLLGVGAVGVYMVFLPAILVSFVLVYTLEGTREARNFILAMVLLYGLHYLADHFLAYHATHPGPGTPPQPHIDLIWFSTSRRFASLAALLTDAVVIIITYQFLVNRLRSLPLGLSLFTALVAAMVADAIVFNILRFDWAGLANLKVVAKAQAGAAAAVPAAIYFAWALRHHDDRSRASILERNALDLLALRHEIDAVRRELEEEHRRYEEIKSTFSRYVSPEVVDALVANPEGVELSGEVRDVTIAFADIRGYSTLAEALDPTEIIGLLNDYFSRVSDVILDQGGLITEIEGDAIISVYGAPVDMPDHADRALSTALLMLAEVETLNDHWERLGVTQKWNAMGLDRFGIRIGIHTGTVVAGNVGSESRMKYTVIGDAVNTAARVEQLTKEMGVNLLFTSDVLAALSERRFVDEAIDLGAHPVKGKVQAVHVYSLPTRAPEDLARLLRAARTGG